MNASPTADILCRLGVADAAGWSPVLTKACAANGITTRNSLAAFLANVLFETTNLHALTESLDYSVQGLLRTFPSHFTADSAGQVGRTDEYEADQEGIAEAIYGGRYGNGVGNGDGWMYRGHGGLMTTFKSNYISLSKATGLPLLGLPALLETRDGTAQSAGLFWKHSGCQAPAEAQVITRVRAIINGGSNGLPQVTAIWRHALQVIN